MKFRLLTLTVYTNPSALIFRDSKSRAGDECMALVFLFEASLSPIAPGRAVGDAISMTQSHGKRGHRPVVKVFTSDYVNALGNLDNVPTFPVIS